MDSETVKAMLAELVQMRDLLTSLLTIQACMLTALTDAESEQTDLDGNPIGNERGDGEEL